MRSRRSPRPGPRGNAASDGRGVVDNRPVNLNDRLPPRGELDEVRTGGVGVDRATVTLGAVAPLAAAGNLLLEDVDLHVGDLLEALAPDLHDVGAERLPGSRVKGRDGPLVPTGDEKC